MLFANANVFFDDRGFVPAGLRVENGVFADVLPPESTEAGAVDLGSAKVIPGLIDLHIHGCMGADFSDGEEEGLRTMAAFLAQRGVTGFLPTSMTLPYEKLRRALAGEVLPRVPVAKNDRQKARILSGSEPFLRLLGVSDENGRVYDKKQAKFRQINRFLELIRDCLPHLPKEGTLRICDLCCGKSYLSFAAYHYFANVLGRTVRMTGVDLKPDVMEFCADAAKKLGFTGLEFRFGDVAAYDAGEHVHLVLSLHACDIATDLVLSRAVAFGADVILSTPCCHHELNHNLDCPALGFLSEYSMLRQKFCDAATDALRLKYLEACGYTTCALELIDPEETPKNILLRGVKRKDFDPAGDEAKALWQAYESAKTFLVGGGNVQKALSQKS